MNPVTTLYPAVFGGMLIGYGAGIDAMVTDLFAYAAGTILLLFAVYVSTFGRESDEEMRVERTEVDR